MKVIVTQLERVVGWFEFAFGTPVRPRAGSLSDSGAQTTEAPFCSDYIVEALVPYHRPP